VARGFRLQAEVSRRRDTCSRAPARG
jgi:hypothetical protein